MTKVKLKIFNTLTRQKEEVKPLEDNLVRIYSCGLTVYDYAHIGNLRKYIFDDLLRRTLLYFGYRVKQVMNITDVGHLTSDEDEGEDKIEVGARREKRSAWEIAKFYEKVFISDLKKLNILLPDEMPRATENIKEQIELIKILEEKGFTYKTSDGIYFDTSKLKDYGKLARLDLGGLKEGCRIEKNPEKKNLSDFALWKFSKKIGERQMEWHSPWGVGFPGWHLECSAMSVKFLGQPFEIHTGGVDHIAVHHTNEIAQSEAAEGKPLAKYWVHCEHLLENGHKMSKSAGHFIRLQDLEEKGFSPLDFRFLCLQAHYRSKLNFSWQALEGAREARRKINNIYNSAQKSGDISLKNFDKFLSDDLDTPKALAFVFENLASFGREEFEKIDSVLGILEKFKVKKADGLILVGEISKEVVDLAKERNLARLNKDFAKSDALRKKIEGLGFVVEDSKEGTKISPK